MTLRTAFALVLATVVWTGCHGSSPAAQQPPTTPTAPPAHPHTTGTPHDFPDPMTYASSLDDPERDAWQKPAEVVALLDAQPGMTVVDLGVGTGYFLPSLSEAVGPRGRVLGLDTEPGMIEWVQTRIEREHLDNVEPRKVDAEDPKLERSSVDRILVVNVWHHIHHRTEYATKLRQSLRPEGMLLIVDFEATSPIGPPASMRLTSDTVVRELEEAGFDAEALPESLPHQYVVAARVP